MRTLLALPKLGLSMHADISRLLDLMVEQEQLLRKHGEVFWANWIEQSRKLIKAGKLAGIVRITGAFGGMGSLTDLVVSHRNGHLIDGAESEIEINRKLQKLSSSVYGLATVIRDKRDAYFAE